MFLLLVEMQAEASPERVLGARRSCPGWTLLEVGISQQVGGRTMNDQISPEHPDFQKILRNKEEKTQLSFF